MVWGMWEPQLGHRTHQHVRAESGICGSESSFAIHTGLACPCQNRQCILCVLHQSPRDAPRWPGTHWFPPLLRLLHGQPWPLPTFRHKWLYLYFDIMYFGVCVRRSLSYIFLVRVYQSILAEGFQVCA